MEALIKDYVLEENLLVKCEPEDAAQHDFPDEALLKEEILTEDEGELEREEDSDGHGGTGQDTSTVFEMVVAADCDEIYIKDEIWSNGEWVLEEDAFPMQPEDEEANPTPEQSEARASPSPESNTVHEYEVKGEVFHCKLCKFKSKVKWTVQRHLLMHQFMKKKSPKPQKGNYKKKDDMCEMSEQEYEVKDEIFHCKLCKFKSKVKWTVQRHLLVHRFKMKNSGRQPSPPEMINEHDYKVKDGIFHCKFCNFKSKSDWTLERHLLDHQPTIDVGGPLFACFQCPYETGVMHDLQMHYRMHPHKKKEAEECSTTELVYEVKDEIFHCKLCKFKSKVEWTVQRHLLVHRFKMKNSG